MPQGASSEGLLLKDFIAEAVCSLLPLYPEGEARSVVLLLCGDLLGTKSYTHIIEPGPLVPAEKEDALRRAVERLRAGEPVQYVTGRAEFCGRMFNVNPSVLIPRGETEQLCAGARREAGRMAREGGPFGRAAAGAPESGIRILDLCTGSGCVAWTMALDVPGARVTGVDISDGALRTAESQPFSAADAGFSAGGAGFSAAGVGSPAGSACLPMGSAGLPAAGAGSPVVAAGLTAGGPACGTWETPSFVKADVLDTENFPDLGTFALVLSNPPYVRDSEKALMRVNVLDFEPHLALFVPDSDPLVFYRAIALLSKRMLAAGGTGMAEINEDLAAPTARIFSDAGFSGVEVLRDINDRNRMVVYRKSV